MTLFTVTISRAQDPRGGRDLSLWDAAQTQGWSPATCVCDPVYFLLLPDATPREQVDAFAQGFFGRDPADTAFVANEVGFPQRGDDEASILVLRQTGVMDPIAGSVLHALADAGFDPSQCEVRAARRFRLSQAATREQLKAFAEATLANPIVDECHAFAVGEAESIAAPFHAAKTTAVQRNTVALRALDDSGLERLSDEGGLSLTLEEMQTIQAHYRELDRDPTDVELETLAQTWSEHCCHKTFTGRIQYGAEEVQNLLKETIFGVTQEIDAPYCLSVFRDNAGVIALDEEWALTFKAETHNHPSALEPYGGAGTGVGGVIRDTLGTGLGARPILNTDVFCFGPLDHPEDELPAGSLHPRRLLTGVVAGVRDYGNRMGIPTANGAILFDPGYVGNPLVFCGSVGLIPRSCVDKEVRPGDLIVAIGGRTGRDGIHGATFSSRELTEESETVSAGAVQIGNPIEEKKVQDALLRARDQRLYTAVTDCGAGGFSSAVGEMGEEVGARVDLARAPLKYAGLEPREIWISEAQERMVLSVPPEHHEALLEILEEEEVESCVLGEFTGDGVLRLEYDGVAVGELSMDFLHNGRPKSARQATPPTTPAHVALDFEGVAPVELLRGLLAHPTIASKEPVIRQYDHEVQGRVVARPLTGERGDAPGDGVALDPLRDQRFTMVVGCGIQPGLGAVDPYQMGAQSVDEAIRNVISSGGNLEKLVLLDNFAWGNVHDPEILGAAVECARGAADAARVFGTPFISGKDSLHNTYRAGGVSRSIPHTLLVSALSVVSGTPRTPSTDAKAAGNRLLLLGPDDVSWAGSLVQSMRGGQGGAVAQFDGAVARAVYELLADWIATGRVASCHDLSEGGLAVAAAELGIGGSGQGVDLDVPADSDLLLSLFGEGPHRFLLEVAPAHVESLLSADVPIREVGQVSDTGTFRVTHGTTEIWNQELTELRALWKAPLEQVWG